MLSSISHLQLEQVMLAIRQFFQRRDFHEVIPPVLNQAIPLEPNIYPFTTDWHVGKQPQTFFLSTSPERSLKLALAQGIGNYFAIGHCFRDLEGSGPIHSPEFLMLEWYREGAIYTDIMKDVQALILFVHKRMGSSLPLQKKLWPTMSMVDLFSTHVRISMFDLLEDSYLLRVAKKKGYTVGQATWSQLFDQLFLNEIEPHLPETPFFLLDFPTRISPLCTPQQKRPYLAQRFELFLRGMEIGNGNTEFTDTTEIKKTFLLETKVRQRQQRPAPPVDTQFLNALDRLKPGSYAGMGVGVDRLAMLLSE